MIWIFQNQDEYDMGILELGQARYGYFRAMMSTKPGILELGWVPYGYFRIRMSTIWVFQNQGGHKSGIIDLGWVQNQYFSSLYDAARFLLLLLLTRIYICYKIQYNSLKLFGLDRVYSQRSRCCLFRHSSLTCSRVPAKLLPQICKGFRVSHNK